jgi:hypothetical protein
MSALHTVQASAPPSGPEAPFSLFDGDLLQRVYVALGMGSHRAFYKTRRCLVGIAVTYVPMAILAWRQGFVDAGVTPTNFFADFAAYAIFLAGLPLFLVSEIVIDASTREAAEEFLRCDIVSREDRPRVYRVQEEIRRWRLAWPPEAVLIALAYVFSLWILVPQFGEHPLPTWHVMGDEHHRFLTAPGIWAFFVAIPLLNYIWLRIGWKTVLWIYFLYRVSRLRLDLHPAHPDLTGGIGFLSEAQGRFALFILAYGISNVAAPVGYQIAVQNYDLSIPPVWGPLVGFAIGAPLLFTLPLFLFTKQLYRNKRRALAAYRERAMAQSRIVEARLLFGDPQQPVQEEIRQLAEQSLLGSMFTRIEHMRVVPFDLRSLGQLMGSTLGALATLLPLLHGRGEVAETVEALSKVLERLGGQ